MRVGRYIFILLLTATLGFSLGCLSMDKATKEFVEGDRDRAVQMLKKLASKGNGKACLALSTYYKSIKNAELAQQYFVQGHQQGQLNTKLPVWEEDLILRRIGHLYEQAEVGNSGSQMSLAAIHSGENPIFHNPEKAEKWLVLAAENGDAEAKKKIAERNQ